jgi:hypothetical protein
MLGGNVDIAIDSMTDGLAARQAGHGARARREHTERSASAPEVPAIGEPSRASRPTAWQGPVRAGRHAEADRRQGSRPKPRRIWGLAGGEETAHATPAPIPCCPTAPEPSRAFTREQRVKWGEVVKAADVKIE